MLFAGSVSSQTCVVSLTTTHTVSTPSESYIVICTECHMINIRELGYAPPVPVQIQCTIMLSLPALKEMFTAVNGSPWLGLQSTL